MTVTHLTGPALDLMRDMPAGSVDAVITSPPFWNLRDYGQNGQWGSEESPAAFLGNLLDLAAECRRVITPTGSLVFELGDTRAGSGGAGGDYAAGGLRDGQARFNGSAARARAHAQRTRTNGQQPGCPPAKSACFLPELFGASLAYGRNLLDPVQEFEPWIIRNKITWARRNPPVGALGDKFRDATSLITVACTARDRWFDLDAVRTPLTEQGRTFSQGANRAKLQPHRDGAVIAQNPAGAPPLDHWWDEPDPDLVWLINTQGSNLAHYAMWPPRLAERLVLSMVPTEACRGCGEPRRRIVDVEPSPRTVRHTERLGSTAGNGHHGHLTRQATTIDWSTCGHDNYRPGVVLDPFSGAGTTLAVADIHGRDAIGFDLDPSNRQLYEARYRQCWKGLGRDGASPVTEHGEQLGLALEVVA